MEQLHIPRHIGTLGNPVVVQSAQDLVCLIQMIQILPAVQISGVGRRNIRGKAVLGFSPRLLPVRCAENHSRMGQKIPLGRALGSNDLIAIFW